MKLLVFAHKPPPHHGQSYMVQLFLEALAAQPKDERFIAWFHVDARLSTGVDDLGSVRFGKLFLIFKYCLQAIWLRFRHGISDFYYVPADPKRSTLYRDWIVMALCRPFFKRIVFHWHASGLADFLQTQARPWERWISHRLLSKPGLSLVLADFNRADAEYFRSQKITVVPNGIPDPCPGFEETLLPIRLDRAKARQELANTGHSGETLPQAEASASTFRVLYLSLCHEPKGLFDAIEAVLLANSELAAPFRMELRIAGSFWSEEEKQRFELRLRQPDIIKEGRPLVTYEGFVSGEAKRQLFTSSDCLCFPTWYPAEGQPVVLLEAMAFGLSVVTTRWRAIPEMFPPDYAGVVPPKDPKAISRALIMQLRAGYDPRLRERFCRCYTAAMFGAKMKAALLDGSEPN